MPLPYWKTSVSDENEVYSCDMVRFNFELGNKCEVFNSWIQKKAEMDSNYEVKEYISIKPFTYRNMLNIKTVYKNSFVIGYCFNGVLDKKTTGFIEFNPNKLFNDSIFIEFWNTLSRCVYWYELVRYDLAIDLPISRQYVSMPKQGNFKYQYINSGSITETLGVHNNSGFIKVYDKTKESNIKEDITRIEITLNKNDIASEKMPHIYIKDYQIALQEENDLSQNDKVFVMLLQDIEYPDTYLDLLTYRKREKLKQYLSRKEWNINKVLAHNIREYVFNIEKTKGEY